MKRTLIAGILLMLLALVVGACAGAPAAPQVQTVVVPETVVVQPTGAPTAAATATTSAPTPIAQVPSDALAQKGKLLVCTDFPYPPQESFDDNGNPQGMDIDIGIELGKRLGLQTVYVNSIFDTIIAAVKGGKCDIIISAMNITASRQKEISFIPYFKTGQSLLVAKGNPKNINTPLDLCGQKAAAETGTTEADFLEGAGDFDPVKGTPDSKGQGLPQLCQKAGKPAPTAVTADKDSDALQQLQTGKVVTYFADTPVAGYYAGLHPDQFQLAGQVISPATEGIGIPCGKDDCSSGALSPFGQAVQTAFQSMLSDGTYKKILDKWGLTEFAIQ